MQESRLLQPPHDQWHAAGLVQVGGDELAAGLEIAQQRRALADPVEVVDMSSIAISLAIASRCRTPFVEPPLQAIAAIAFSRLSRVMIWLGRRRCEAR